MSLQNQFWYRDAKKLIKSVAGISDESENFEICLQFLSSNINFHNYVVVNPRQIRANIDGLIEKFEVQAKYKKASRLSLLVKTLTSSVSSEDATSQNSDCDNANNAVYSLLSLLLILANSPVEASLKKEDESLHLFSDETSSIDWAEYLRERSYQSSFHIEDLSDWSDEGAIEDSGDHPVILATPKREDSGIDISADAKSTASSIHNLASTPSPVQQTSPQVKFKLGTPVEGSAVVPVDGNFNVDQISIRQQLINPYWRSATSDIKLGSTLSSNLLRQWHKYLNENGVVSDNDNCVTEWQVSREILWMLQGVEDSYLFQFDGDTEKFVVRKNIQVSHLTPSALRSFLSEFCEYGNIVIKLKNFIADVSRKKNCQTYEAYANGLAQFLRQFTQEISSLEKILINQEQTLTMNDVIDRILPSLDTLQELREVHETGIATGNVSFRTCAVVLLSSLYNQVTTHEFLHDKSVILSLFLVTCRPYINMIDKFIGKANAEDIYGELFISRVENVDIKSEKFWTESITNHVSRESGCVKFLETVKDDIFIAGKSIEMLIASGEMYCLETKFLQTNMYEELVRNLCQQLTLNSINSPIPSQVNGQADENLTFDNDLMKHMKRFGCYDPFLYRNFTNLTMGGPSSKSNRANKSHSGHSIDVWNIKKSSNVPLQVALDRSISAITRSKCNDVSVELIKVILTEYRLMFHLNFVRKIYLMEAGDVMFAFYSSIFKKLRLNKEWRDIWSLNMALQDAVSYHYPNDAQNIGVHLDSCVTDSLMINSLDGLKLVYQVPWPINTILTKKAFETYNKIFTFLLQIKRAKFCLEQMRFSELTRQRDDVEDPNKVIIAMLVKGELPHSPVMPRQQLAHIMQLLRLRLLYFTDSLHDYIMTRILHETRLELEESLKKAKNIEEIMKIHQEYLNRIYERCLLHSSMKILKDSITSMLNLVLLFQLKWNCGVDKISVPEMCKIEEKFSRCYQFLSMFFNSLVKRGSFHHLESLAFALETSKLPTITKPNLLR